MYVKDFNVMIMPTLNFYSMNRVMRLYSSDEIIKKFIKDFYNLADVDSDENLKTTAYTTPPNLSKGENKLFPSASSKVELR